MTDALQEIFDLIISSKVLDQLDRPAFDDVMTAGRKLSNLIAEARQRAEWGDY